MGNTHSPFFHCSESMIEVLNKEDTSNDQASVMQLNLKDSNPTEFSSSNTSGATFARPCRPTDPQTSTHSVFPSSSMVGKVNICHVNLDLIRSSNMEIPFFRFLIVRCNKLLHFPKYTPLSLFAGRL